ncbi:MAG: hypothetical protein ACJ79U_08965 [Myxococcales bacterium]
MHLGLALRSFALAFWFGGGLATLLATSAVFARTPDRKLAGDLAGAILSRTGTVRSLMVVLLLAAVILGTRGAPTALGAACAVVQVLSLGADVLTRRVRRAAGGTIDALPPGDPRRRRFAALHGVAMLLLLLQVLAAGAGLLLAG